jgi:3-oxoacyl-[acyl-carrier protein] reductase
MSQILKDKVAIVTGASRGLGASIASKLAAAGAKVVVNYFASAEKAEKLVNSIKQAGGQAIALAGDARSEKDISKLVADTEKAFGSIDIIVPNGTGPQPFIKVEDLTWQACLDQLEFFVKSPLLLLQAALPAMKKKKWGRVINIGSEVFEKGVPEFSQYVAAKGAQLGLTRSWAMELAKWNITVNLVAPGWIPTERHANDSQELKDQYAKAVPLGHMGVPDDIGDAVTFLASDAAKFITGQKLSVNGGTTLA